MSILRSRRLPPKMHAGMAMTSPTPRARCTYEKTEADLMWHRRHLRRVAIAKTIFKNATYFFLCFGVVAALVITTPRAFDASIVAGDPPEDCTNNTRTTLIIPYVNKTSTPVFDVLPNMIGVEGNQTQLICCFFETPILRLVCPIQYPTFDYRTQMCYRR